MKKYSLTRFLKNIKFLMKFDLKEREELQKNDILEYTKDICRYEILDKDISHDEYMLDVLDYDKTVDLLLKFPKSFCRFGDGEIELIKGNSISFQKYDKSLSKMLLEILVNNTDNCYVGLNYNYFHSTEKLNYLNKKFYFTYAKKYRDFLLMHCCRERRYIAAGFNQLYTIFEKYDYETYFKKIRELFKNRDIVVFVGDGVLRKLKFDVFELAKSKEFIYGPNKNAFDEFDVLLEKARKYPKNKTLVFILGPCSKALVYELSKDGYTAWDVGHMAKDYDAYRRGIEKTDKFINDFYSPD